ncbi:ANTAR domain-containing response regulator [Mesorhizobium humile]|uniref:ANTAR domain-containing protein n=1 Tax=Mesorhizobium humile TaxID=3072313 RepID=A0ABU4YFV1_9HYPH|nr:MULTISPECIES: ANTAR domain-containing protein [unclassified Mesorhizobium]MDX8485616.1 ANTAR domain-containing protein [Mesorhizobium sp. VK2B]
MMRSGREQDSRGAGQWQEKGPHGQSSGQASPKVYFDLNVAVIVERDDDGERLVRELQRLRCSVHHIWPMPPQIPAQFDAIYCALTDDLPQRLPWIPGEPAAALVVVERGGGALDLRLMHNCAAHGVLHYPTTARSVQASLALARGHYLYEKRLRGRIDKLDESLRTMRSVERAKSLLIRVKHVSEEEAYNYLRRQAMERRVTIGAVANAIIDSHELLS